MPSLLYFTLERLKMTESFKQQLQELIDQAAEKYSLQYDDPIDRTWSVEDFKQGCEVLMPMLIKAVEEKLNKSEKELGVAFSVDESDIDALLENLKKELLQLLKGER